MVNNGRKGIRVLRICCV